jgi:hypothetical protein
MRSAVLSLGAVKGVLVATYYNTRLFPLGRTQGLKSPEPHRRPPWAGDPGHRSLAIRFLR